MTETIAGKRLFDALTEFGPSANMEGEEPVSYTATRRIILSRNTISSWTADGSGTPTSDPEENRPSGLLVRRHWFRLRSSRV